MFSPFPFPSPSTAQQTLLLSFRLQNKAIVVANAIMNVFDKGDATAVRNARKLAEEVFGEGWEAKGAGIYEEGPTEAQIWGIGEHFCCFLFTVDGDVFVAF
jgi:hypothetical protein